MRIRWGIVASAFLGKIAGTVALAILEFFDHGPSRWVAAMSEIDWPAALQRFVIALIFYGALIFGGSAVISWLYRRWRAWRAPRPPPTHDIGLVEAVRALGGLDDDMEAQELMVAGAGALRRLRQAAVLEAIHTWGREDAPRGNPERTPLIPIPADHWQYHWIDALDWLGQQAGQGLARTSAAERGAGPTTYADVHFNRAELDALRG